MTTDDIDNATDTPSTWPPPIYADDHIEPENTSGMNTTVPIVVARLSWCWGGFALPLFWSFANKCPVFGLMAVALGWLEVYYLAGSWAYGFLHGPGVLVLLADFGLRLTLALSGYSHAWRNRRFEGGIPHFIAVQRRWTFWAIVCVITPPAWYIFFDIIRIF